MELRKWSDIPERMRTREVRRYYNIIIRHSGWLHMKRILDVAAACLLLLVLGIPMIFIGLAIKLDSPGPVFFRQERITQYGRIFKIFKFRTMVANASQIGTAVTVDNDMRITGIGAFLRKYRLDEFPQLFNIIAGDMTLVGTRPEVAKYVNQYTPEMYATLLLPAGLTSRTSIAYKDEDKLLKNADDADKVYVEEVLPCKMKYNLESIRKFGIWSDMSVLWDTFVSVLKR
ncbi:MAG: sugar transferase [Eubacteriales bacterium]|nr:sugar transferase [Eubacteriales bacterium]